MDEKIDIQSHTLKNYKSSLKELTESGNKYKAMIEDLQVEMSQRENEFVVKLKEHNDSLSGLKSETEKCLQNKQQKMTKIYHRMNSTSVLVNLLQKQLNQKCVTITQLEQQISKQNKDKPLTLKSKNKA